MDEGQPSRDDAVGMLEEQIAEQAKTIDNYRDEITRLMAERDRLAKRVTELERGGVGPVMPREWAVLFPEGRHIYYEGDDPEGFRAEIREKFDFDPGEQPDQGFDCPAELLDAIYGGQYPMGS